MKKSVKKFLKLLDKDIDKINARFEKLIDEYVQNQRFKFKSQTEFQLSIEKIMSSMYQDLEEEDRKAFGIMEQAKEIKSMFSDRKPITDFILIQGFMNRYELTELEQADVIAYALRLNVNEVLGLKAWCIKIQEETGINYIEVCRNMVLQSEAEQRGAVGIASRLKNVIAHFDFVRKKEIEESAINMFETAERLTHLINEEGEIMGCNSPHDYIKPNSAPNFNIIGSQLRAILKASMAKHEQERKQRLEAEKLEAKKATNIHSISRETFKATDKERREALQWLKNFLVNGMPIRFIAEAELIEITRMLIIAGYDEHQISVIEKNILTHNQSVIESRNKEAIHNARIIYLSDEERIVMDRVSAIVKDENALKNAVYNKIVEDYNLLLEQLLNIGSKNKPEDFAAEDLELLHMCIEALQASIVEYANSDYRRMLVPKK